MLKSSKGLIEFVLQFWKRSVARWIRRAIFAKKIKGALRIARHRQKERNADRCDTFHDHAADPCRKLPHVNLSCTRPIRGAKQIDPLITHPAAHLIQISHRDL